jgi:hypothetical protein
MVPASLHGAPARPCGRCADPVCPRTRKQPAKDRPAQGKPRLSPLGRTPRPSPCVLDADREHCARWTARARDSRPRLDQAEGPVARCLAAGRWTRRMANEVLIQSSDVTGLAAHRPKAASHMSCSA